MQTFMPTNLHYNNNMYVCHLKKKNERLKIYRIYEPISSGA